jgi:hypothetical protein
MPPRLSPLDTERFGVVTARADAVGAADVGELLAFCEEHGAELVIARCDAADQAALRALGAAGLALVEEQITYRGPLVETSWPAGIREARPGDAAEIEALAQAGFDDYAGHYHADPRLPRDACREVYVDWTRRGLAGEAADVVYVAEHQGELTGYGMFARTGEDEITYLLAAVAPTPLGRGLYLGFLNAGMAWGLDAGASAVVGVTTPGSIAAQRNLIRSGLRPTASSSTFHGWRDQAPWPARSSA